MSTSVEIPTAAPTSAAAEHAPHIRPIGGQDSSPSPIQGLDLWLENFRKYEATLQEVTRVSADAKFKAELGTIEKWFKVLSEAERTTSVYTLLLHSNQDQIRFFISVLQQMIRPEPATLADPTADGTKARQGLRNIRPPSLNLPLSGSPTTPRFNTPITAKDSASLLSGDGEGVLESQRLPEQVPSNEDGSTNSKADDGAGAVGTPLNSAFQTEQLATDDDNKKLGNGTAQGISGLPGLGTMNPFHLNMLANAGLSTEAQLLAVQLVMSGLVQPAGSGVSQSQRQSQPLKKPSHLGDSRNWRTPTSAKYPGSALRSSGLRSSAMMSAGLKSAGIQSSGLQSAGLPSSGFDSASSFMASPREEDFDPEMLNDIPAWLRGLRLHKYTSCFDGLSWQEMVVLDDATLEAKGIVALGARRRLLRTFEHVKKRMGIESPNSVTPTTSSLFPNTTSVTDAETTRTVPHTAAPTSKLSINSPVFTPASDRGLQSAAAILSVTPSSSV